MQASGHCLLTSRGEVFCFGNNFRLGGLPDSGGQIEPRRIPLPGKASWIAEGPSHVCAVLTAGAVWCWGNGHAVGLPPDVEWQLEPLRIEGIPPVVGVYPGWGSTCTLAERGDAWCWGAMFGELPPVLWRPDLRFVDIAIGSSTACGLTDDGRVFCTGESNGCGLGFVGLDCFVDIEKAVATDDHGPEFEYAAWPAK